MRDRDRLTQVSGDAPDRVRLRHAGPSHECGARPSRSCHREWDRAATRALERRYRVPAVRAMTEAPRAQPARRYVASSAPKRFLGDSATKDIRARIVAQRLVQPQCGEYYAAGEWQRAPEPGALPMPSFRARAAAAERTPHSTP